MNIPLLIVTKKLPVSSDIETIMAEQRVEKFTGVLKITLDACVGLVFLDDGEIVDRFELFGDKLLVKDADGSDLLQRCNNENCSVDICNMQKDILYIFLKVLQEKSIENIKSLFPLFF